MKGQSRLQLASGPTLVLGLPPFQSHHMQRHRSSRQLSHQSEILPSPKILELHRPSSIWTSLMTIHCQRHPLGVTLNHHGRSRLTETNHITTRLRQGMDTVCQIASDLSSQTGRFLLHLSPKWTPHPQINADPKIPIFWMAWPVGPVG